MRKRAGASVLLCMLAFAAATPAALADGRPGPVRAAGVHLRLGSRVLATGMVGIDVFHLQVLLGHRGYAVSRDGGFGVLTRAAVIRAQLAYGLAPDGIVGPLTLGALRSGRPVGCSSAPGRGDYVTRWAPVVACVLGMLHQSSRYTNDILIIIRFESAGNPAAINLWDVNARRGDPSRGLMQVIGRTFARFRNPVLSRSIYDPAANIYAGVNYALAVYRSIGAIPGIKAISMGAPYRPYKLAAGP